MMKQTLAQRLREAIAVTIDRNPSADLADAATAAVMGQLADIIGEATRGFQNPRYLHYKADLREHAVLGSHIFPVAALRTQVLGEEHVPSRRFYVCHSKSRQGRENELDVTFVRFEQETLPADAAKAVAWDVLDPSWPEVRKVLEVLQEALGEGGQTA